MASTRDRSNPVSRPLILFLFLPPLRKKPVLSVVEGVRMGGVTVITLLAAPSPCPSPLVGEGTCARGPHATTLLLLRRAFEREHVQHTAFVGVFAEFAKSA